MIKTVEEYNKWVKIDENEMTMYQVGKLNPKNELLRNIEEITTEAISQNLNLLVKHDAF